MTVEPDEGQLAIAVETEAGVFVRRIRPAAVLPPTVDPGTAAEGATRTAAAVWGLPDFVFQSAVRSTGSGVRELGDSIIIAGQFAAVVQVKARAALSADLGKERGWLDKRIDKAARQAAGTIKAFATRPDAALINERGTTVEVNARDKAWVPVVVLDHPGVHGYTPTVQAVVLLRRDWEFLFEQLKSTHAVLGYLHRVHLHEPIPLGDEPLRYYRLAADDAVAEPSSIDAGRLSARVHQMSTPLLPQAPAGHDDRRHHLVLRTILEEVAKSPLPEKATAADIIDVLAAVDTTPVGYRSELGRDIIKWLHDVAQVDQTGVKWQFRIVSGTDRVNLIFAAASRYDETVRTHFRWYISLRHQQLSEALPIQAEALTVGVLLTPRHDGLRPWDTTMVATKGEQGLDVSIRQQLEALWGEPGTNHPTASPDTRGNPRF
ncbi:hypothetical protein ACWEOZ_15425 [Actinoplanes sp. NPDC004185]